MVSTGSKSIRGGGLCWGALALAPLLLWAQGCGLSALIGGVVVTSTQSSSSGAAATPPPSVTALSPATASHMGGILVSIQGSNFPTDPLNPPRVTVAGVEATEVTVQSSTALSVKLPRSTQVGAVDVVVANPRGGTGTLSGVLTYTNDLPQAAVTPLSVSQTLNLVFSVTLSDPESDRVDLTLEYRIGGGAYAPIPDAQILSGGTKDLATSPTGVTHNLTWNTSASFGAQNASQVEIRATPTDTTDRKAGAPASSNLFSIVNNLAPTLALTTPTADSFEVAISYRVADPNPGAALTLTSATWRDTSSGATGALTIKSGTPASVPSAIPVSVSGVAHSLVWDSFKDLGFGNNRLVEVTLVASDGTQSISVTSGAFFVSNGPVSDNDVNPANLTQLKGFSTGDLNGDGRPDAFATTDVIRSYSLLINSGQTFQSPQVTALLGFPTPISTQIAWNGTTSLSVTGSTSPVQVGDWLSLPLSYGGTAIGDPIGPRAFRVSAVAAGTITIEDPDNYAGSGLLPGSAALGGAVPALTFLTQRQAGRAGLSATGLPNDFRPGESTILSVDEDLSSVAAPTSDVVIANALPTPVVTTLVSAAGNVLTLTSLTPFAPFDSSAFQVGMLIQITQGGVGTAQGRITATDPTAKTVTLAAAPGLAFTAGAIVNALTSGNYFVHAGHQRNHSLIVLPQTGGQLGAPTTVIPTGGTFTNDLLSVDLASLGGGPDGKVDLITVNGATTNPASTKGSISIFLRKAAGALFETPIVVEVGTGGSTPARPVHAVIADVTSNGLLDIVVANQGESSVSIVTQGPAGTFNAATTINLAAYGLPAGDVNAVAVADFNGDGLPDLVCGGALSQRLLVLRGADPDGAGPLVSFPGANVTSPTLLIAQSPAPPPLLAGAATSQPAATFFVGVSPRRLVAGDIDGDGRVDLAVAVNVQNRITLFMNRGNVGAVTNFSEVALTTSLGPVDLELGDVSGDERPDLLVGGSLLGDISRFQALVPGTLDRFVSFPVGSGPQGLVIADLTPDFPGREVVVVNNGDTSITVLARDGAGGLRALSPSANQRDVSLEAQDMALLAPTAGTGSLRLLAAAGAAAEDFNGDGRLDLVVFTQSSTLGRAGAAVLLNEGGVAPIRTTSRVLLARTAGLSGTAAQVVGDATPDLVFVEFTGATSGAFNVFRGAAGTNFVQDVIVNLALPSAVTPFDIDGDGDLDLLAPLNASSPPNFSVLLQNPVGTLAAPSLGVTGGIQLPGFSGTSYTAAGDLNNDGLQDVAFTNFLGSLVAVAFQNKPATNPPKFDTVIPVLSLLQPSQIVLGDLNGDGLTDMAIVFAGDNRVGIYYQRPGANKLPAASLQGPILLPTGPAPFSCEIEDINGDGRADLVVTSRGANTVDVFFQR